MNALAANPNGCPICAAPQDGTPYCPEHGPPDSQIVVCRNQWPIRVMAPGTTSHEAEKWCEENKAEWIERSGIKPYNVGRIYYHWHWISIVGVS